MLALIPYRLLVTLVTFSCLAAFATSVPAQESDPIAAVSSEGLTQTLTPVPRRFAMPAPGDSLIGELDVVSVGSSDTLADITANHRLGYNLVRSANPNVDAWLPEENSQVIIPGQAILPQADHEGLVINVAEMRLYQFSQNGADGKATVGVYPISVGRGDWQTPMTETKITGRVKDPTWYPPASIRREHAEKGDPLPSKVPPGPDNPLGEYLLMLDIPSYFIHGTNKKFGIGMQVTHGCIRMYAEDIEYLAKTVPKHTPVRIINQRVKIGWAQDTLYLEVHPTLEGDERPLKLADVVKAVVTATKTRPETIINWPRIEEATKQAIGLPIKVGELPQA